MAKEHKRLGDLLVESQVITPENLEQAVAEQKKTGQMLGAALIKLGLVTEQQVLQTLHQQLGLPLVDLDNSVADEPAIGKVNEQMARKYGAVPLEIQGRWLIVAMSDPLNVGAIEDLRFHTGLNIRPVLASASQIAEALERYYNADSSMKDVLETIISTEDDVIVDRVSEEEGVGGESMAEIEGRPIVKLTNWVLNRAVESRASDIHIEPQDRDLVVRFRIDGLLHEEQRLPKWTQGALISRIKVLSNMDIAEKRQPQDGRLRAEIDGRRIDLRVSTLPVAHGEKVVMRVVDSARALVALEEIGFYPEDLTHLKRHLERPQGIVLVTGPTGSGKSTLLYAALRYIHKVTKNIVTVEDPIELQIPGINQVQVDERAKKTFPAALRAILRQDPDVIMIGEVRDAETAQIAFRASVTGHLVLSTIHTNDAASAVTRLIDLGLEAFMVGSALISAVGIRLVRTLCTKCREPYEADASTLNRLTGGTSDRQGSTITLYRGRGCPNCNETGYRGRTGIFEILEIDDQIRSLIAQGASDASIRQAAIEAGMRSIGEDGLRKAMEGRTTIEEVTRVVYLAEHQPKVCTKCQSVLPRDYEYCTRCGEYVGEHCGKCRRRVTPEWDFCPYCGSDTERTKNPTAEPSPPPVSIEQRAAA